MRFLFGRKPVKAVLRRATMADAPGLAALHARCFAHPWSTITFESMLGERNVHADVADAGDPVGFVLSRAAADEAEILSVAVDPGRRGAGLGRRLVEANLDALAGARVRQVFLEVEDGNVPALAVYRHLGFLPVGSRPGYYRAADGSRRDAVMMRIDLAMRPFRSPVPDA